MLYTGFIWGRWEMGLLTEVTEEMELELRIVEMEEKSGRGWSMTKQIRLARIAADAGSPQQTKAVISESGSDTGKPLSSRPCAKQ
jgi:hypothetical protein